jgi:hypothetical protein
VSSPPDSPRSGRHGGVSATDIARLGRAIFDLHGVSATHMRSENVIETFEGKTAREGTVDMFTVHGHAWAGFAYAWSFENDKGNR